MGLSTPVDYAAHYWPMKTKYIDEETFLFNRWFIFGEFPDGSVGICDGTNDIFDRIPRERAEKIIEARKIFCNSLIKALNE